MSSRNSNMAKDQNHQLINPGRNACNKNNKPVKENHQTSEASSDLADSPIFACKYCNRQLNSRSRIFSHVFIYHWPDQMPCLYCQSRFDCYESLKNHVINNHGKHEKEIGVLFSKFYLNRAVFNTGKKICRIFYKNVNELEKTLRDPVEQKKAVTVKTSKEPMRPISDNLLERAESNQNSPCEQDRPEADNLSSPKMPALIQKFIERGNLLSAMALCCLKLRLENDSLFCDTCKSQLPFGNSTLVRNHISGHLHCLNRTSNNCEHNLKLELSTANDCLLVEYVLNNLEKMMIINNEDKIIKEDLIKYQRNRKKSFQCGNCNFGAFDFSEFEKHYNDKHKAKKPICFYCLKQYMDLQSLSKHLEEAHLSEVEKGVWKCGINRCSYFANKTEDLLNHFERFHKFCSRILCYNCLSDYPDFQSVIEHYSRKLRYKCSACNFKTKERNSIQSHLTRDHKATTQCNVITYLACINLFEESEKILLSEGKNIPQIVPKKDISRVLSKRETLTHLETNSYQCGYCDNTTQFSDEIKTIKAHVLRKHITKPLYCHVPGCCFSSVDYNSLTQHIIHLHDMTNLKLATIPNLYLKEKSYKRFGYDIIEYFISEKRLSRTLPEDKCPVDTRTNQRNMTIQTNDELIVTPRKNSLSSPETIGSEVKKRKVSFMIDHNLTEGRKQTTYLCCFCLENYPLTELKLHLAQHFNYKRYFCTVCKKNLFYKNGTKEFTRHALNHDLDPKDCYELRMNKSMESVIKYISEQTKSRMHLSQTERHCLACNILIHGGEEAVDYHITSFHKAVLEVNLHKLESDEDFKQLLAFNGVTKCSLKKNAADRLFI